MSTVTILLALSAATGFAIGTSFSWFAILISSTALSALSAAVLHSGFDALPGIAIIATSLTVHQLAYIMGALLRHEGVALARRASEEAKKLRERPDKTVKTKIWPKLH
jgi:uncharacterized protein (DUF2062 family)